MQLTPASRNRRPAEAKPVLYWQSLGTAHTTLNFAAPDGERAAARPAVVEAAEASVTPQAGCGRGKRLACVSGPPARAMRRRGLWRRDRRAIRQLRSDNMVPGVGATPRPTGLTMRSSWLQRCGSCSRTVVSSQISRDTM